MQNKEPEPSFWYYASDNSLTPETASELTAFALTREWFGAEITPPLSIIIAIDPNAIWFCASRDATPICNMNLKVGEFVEGLWEQDVAEIFIVEERADRHVGPRYQEFNLSPCGAWWSCSFSSYRVREKTSPTRDVQCWSECTTRSWSATMRIPRNSLSVRVAFDNTFRFNACGVLLASGVPQYLSAAIPPAGEPDFHCLDNFRIAEKRSLRS